MAFIEVPESPRVKFTTLISEVKVGKYIYGVISAPTFGVIRIDEQGHVEDIIDLDELTLIDIMWSIGADFPVTIERKLAGDVKLFGILWSESGASKKQMIGQRCFLGCIKDGLKIRDFL